MQTQKIFCYSDFRTFLKTHAENKKNQNPSWSLGIWARQVGVGSTAVLTNILNGTRNPGKSVEQRLIQYFKFNEQEKTYFQDLIRLKKVSDDSRLSVALMEKMGKENPNGSFQLLDDRTFSAISKWYYYALREMVNLEHAQEDPEWIRKHLHFKVTKKEIKKALHDLLKLNLIKRDEKGRLRSTGITIKTQNDIASEGIKRFHEQMLDNSKIAIRHVNIMERDITGRTFNIDEKNLPKVKQLIREFRDKICELFEESSGTRTYQLNVQFFPLTQKFHKGGNHENQ